MRKPLIPALLFIVFFTIYMLGVSPSSFGGDSGDIILSYFFGSIAHPPGYPLNTVLGWFISRFIHLFANGPFAFAANSVSAVYMAGSCALLYVFIFRLTRSHIYSIFGSLTLGFSTLFWLYAHSAEVFQLTIFLILLSFNFLFVWFLNNKSDNKMLYLAIFFLGLAVFHHQTALLFVPSYIYLLNISPKNVLKGKKQTLKLIIIFLAGLLPYLYVILATIMGNLHNWEDARSMESFMRLIARADYGTFSATNSLIGISFSERLTKVIWYFHFLQADFNVVGLVFALFGFIYLFFKNRVLFWFFALSWLLTGPFFMFYAAFPMTESFFKGVTERFLLNSYLIVVLFIVFGLIGIMYGLETFILKLKINRKLLSLVSLTFLLIPFSLAYANFPKSDLSHYEIGGIYAEDILSSANPPGIILVQGDTPSFNGEYSYFVDKVNQDSKFIIVGRLSKPSYRENLLKLYPDLNFPDVFRSNTRIGLDSVVVPLIEANIDRIPVYTFENLPVGDRFELIQQGMLFRIYRKGEEPGVASLKADITAKINNLKFKNSLVKNGYLHFFADNIILNYVNIFYSNGLTFLNRGENMEARKYFLMALDLDFKNLPALFSLGVSYFELDDCDKSREIFEKVVDADPNYWQGYFGLAKVYEKCLYNDQRANELLQKAEDLKNKDTSGSLDNLSAF